jgi:hypothetical protein
VELLLNVALGLAVGGGLFLLFWFRFPILESEDAARMRGWFLVSAVALLGACAAWLLLLGVRAALGAIGG